VQFGLNSHSLHQARERKEQGTDRLESTQVFDREHRFNKLDLQRQRADRERKHTFKKLIHHRPGVRKNRGQKRTDHRRKQVSDRRVWDLTIRIAKIENRYFDLCEGELQSATGRDEQQEC